MRLQQNRHYIWIVAILLLATFVRLNGIMAQSLWIDEGFTWNLTQYTDFFAILSRDVHPPLYFIMIDWWVEIAGTSELSLRYFSLLPSVLSVAMMYQLARELSHQRAKFEALLPLIAMSIMAVAEAETFLAQEARSYTWQVLWACISMWAFLKWSRQLKNQHLVIWMLSTIALIYTFYLGAFIGVVQGIYTLLFLRKRKQVVAIGALVICALTLLPWLLLTSGEQSENISRAEWIRPDAFAFWLDDFRQKYFTGQWALTIALSILGIFVAQKKELKLNQAGVLLLLWFGIPLLLTLILNEIVPTYQPRRVSQIVPAIALLTAFGISNITGKVRWFLVIVLLSYGVLSTDFWRYKQPWRDMAEDTAMLIADSTPLLFELGGDDYAPRYHYGNVLDNSFDFLLDEGEADDDANVLIGLTTWRHLQPDTYESNLPPIINSQDHWWLFYWSSDTGALDWLDTFDFERTATVTVDFNPDVFLYRYDRLPETALASYENGLILRDAIIHDDLSVELLWSSENIISSDYTTSAYLVDENGQLVAQDDSQPFLNQRPMTSWQVGDIIYDPKFLAPNTTLSDNDYQVMVLVYNIVDGEIIRLNTVNNEDTIQIGMLTLKH
ncbi:MAG: hypothetical protein Phog2KO_07470 [Phototrophicaceae bacterium]